MADNKAVDQHFKLARVLAKLLDNQFKVGGFRFGLDPLLGIFPGLGDALPALLAFYIIWIGIRQGIPEQQIALMVRNVLVDFLLGLLPVVGDLSDFVYKSNSRNIEILEKYLPGRIIEGETA